MAHKKAIFDYQYKRCCNEAKDIIKQWYDDNHIAIDSTTIYIVWFAFTKAGYRCMVTSKTYRSNFFEISKNVHTNEMMCSVLQQIECIASPGQIDFIETLID